MKKNITPKSTTREGSLKWFAEREWTATREYWNQYVGEFLILTSDTDEIKLSKNDDGYWIPAYQQDNPRIGEALLGVLDTFADEEWDGDILTADDRIEIALSVK